MAAMTRDDAMRFLSADGHTGKLATASPSGAPHVAPIWLVVDGADLVFTTSSATVKGRHLRANPRAALSVDVEEFPFSFVVVHGPVSLSQGDPALLHWTTTIASRYVPAGRADEFGRRNAVTDELLCRLRVERLTGERDIAL
jgi:PPOX class probable F420-dependent enzyme